MVPFTYLSRLVITPHSTKVHPVSVRFSVDRISSETNVADDDGDET